MLSESTADRAFALLDRHSGAWLEILRRWYVVSDGNPSFAWEAIRLATVLPSSGGIPPWCVDYLRDAAGALVAALREDAGAASTVSEALGLTSARRSVADPTRPPALRSNRRGA